MANIKINPIIAYHGTDEKFNKFDDKKANTKDEGWLGVGHYFSTDKNVARSKKHLATTELKSENPYILHFPSWETNKKELIRNSLKMEKNSSPKEITNKLKELGHDSVHLDYSPVGYNHKEILVFHDNQTKIKSWENLNKNKGQNHGN